MRTTKMVFVAFVMLGVTGCKKEVGRDPGATTAPVAVTPSASANAPKSTPREPWAADFPVNDALLTEGDARRIVGRGELAMIAPGEGAKRVVRFEFKKGNARTVTARTERLTSAAEEPQSPFATQTWKEVVTSADDSEVSIAATPEPSKRIALLETSKPWTTTQRRDGSGDAASRSAVNGVVLPSEPIGVGSAWTVTTRRSNDVGGMDVVRRTRYRVVWMSDDEIEVAWDAVGRAVQPQMRAPAEAHIIGVWLETHGQARMQTRALGLASASIEERMHLSIEESATRQRGGVDGVVTIQSDATPL